MSLGSASSRSAWSRSAWSRLAPIAFLVVGGALGVTAWAVPRDDVPTPGPDARPEQVVAAYISAINVRDFATANAVDARPDSDLGLFSRPGRIELEEGWTAFTSDGGPRRTHVTFEADFVGGDGSLEGRQRWGYVLQRDEAGWHIVDAGVS